MAKDAEDRYYITVLNMTWFFNRELFMSALGDIKLSKPISLRKMGYTIAFFVFWTIPIILIFGLNFSLPYLVLLIAPPIALGHYASKPVWGGKNLIGFVKSLWQFFQEPKGWADLKPTNTPDNEDLYVENEIWISRRRELAKLFAEAQNGNE